MTLASEVVSLFGETASLEVALVGCEGKEVGTLDGAEGAVVGLR